MGPRHRPPTLVLSLLLFLVASCARVQPPPWDVVCREAPYHVGARLSPAVLHALYTLPSFPSMTAVNARCAR